MKRGEPLVRAMMRELAVMTSGARRSTMPLPARESQRVDFHCMPIHSSDS
jgi:hypothetical protein